MGEQNNLFNFISDFMLLTPRKMKQCYLNTNRKQLNPIFDVNEKKKYFVQQRWWKTYNNQNKHSKLIFRYGKYPLTILPISNTKKKLKSNENWKHKKKTNTLAIHTLNFQMNWDWNTKLQTNLLPSVLSPCELNSFAYKF